MGARIGKFESCAKHFEPSRKRGVLKNLFFFLVELPKSEDKWGYMYERIDT